MNTIIRVAKDARFFSNLSNARRALKKVLDVDTATANSFIHQEALEDGGRYWYSEAAAQQAADALVNADKATIVEVTTQIQPASSASFELVGPVQPVGAPKTIVLRPQNPVVKFRMGSVAQLKANAQKCGMPWIICYLIVCRLLVTSVTLRKLMVGILIMQRLNSTHGVNSTGSTIKGVTNYVLLISFLSVRSSNSCGSVLYGGQIIWKLSFSIAGLTWTNTNIA